MSDENYIVTVEVEMAVAASDTQAASIAALEVLNAEADCISGVVLTVRRDI